MSYIVTQQQEQPMPSGIGLKVKFRSCVALFQIELYNKTYMFILKAHSKL
jgi:hypothetical protein